MRSAVFRLATLGALTVFPVPASAHESAAKTSQGTSLAAAARDAAGTVDAFHAALRRGDTRAAAALLADDALIFEAGGAERSKAEYTAHHLPADVDFSKAVTSTVTRRSGNAASALAWVASEGRSTGSYKGKALNLTTTESMVLRRSGSEWKIVHVHWSSAAAR